MKQTGAHPALVDHRPLASSTAARLRAHIRTGQALLRREGPFRDHQNGALARDDGIRIDHLLASPEASDRLRCCWIAPRAREKCV
jgi:hypothetical protein